MSATSSQEPTATQLLDAARGFVEELGERGLEIDRVRQIPQDIAERMAAAGLYRALVPPELGGLGLSPAIHAETCEILATGSASAAWCVFIGASSQYTFGGLVPEQLEEILATPNLITSGVFASTGTAVEQERDGRPGYLVSGTWTWGSGCHNAHWISGGVTVEPAAGHAYDARAYFRPSEIDIDDDWHTVGLRGSGSSTYHARAVWLPATRLTAPRPWGTESVHRLYRFPQFGVLALPIGTIALGMGRSSIEEVLAIARTKTPTGSRRTLAQRPALHRDLAVADTRLRAARSLLYDTTRRIWDDIADRPCTLEDRRELRTAIAHAVTTGAEVVDRMHTVVGGSSVFEDSPLQRNLRDVHVATQHMMVAEPVMELAGRVMVGVDDDAPGL